LLLEPPGDGWLRQVEALAGEVSDPTLRQAAAAALEEHGEELYHSIFGPGGPVSLREASYFDNIQLGYLVAELCAHYEAFGYAPVLDEPPDHAAVEAGFLAYLRLKQAYAVAEGDADAEVQTAETYQRFLTEHVARIGRPLKERCANCGIRCLTLAAEALAERAGTRARSPAVLPIIEDAGEAQFECG
jgi:hypothetical protein